eukprot:TRINITY_DN656_c0_g1_i1.p1 TRINITY_DN656_c0_g1~~TRINITY_DN656_c0_g1_i1.p1  ORF type:complete len:1510 (-),score=442.59 TRINITY_DN656_c0_g1_i1:26-4555(-)
MAQQSEDNLFIEGKFTPSTSTEKIEIRDDIGNVIATVPKANEVDVKRAIDAARRALDRWSSLDSEERRNHLKNCLGWEMSELPSLIDPEKTPTVVVYEGKVSVQKDDVIKAIGPSLASGNTLIIVMSSRSVLDLFEMCKTLKQNKFPRGVINIVTGDFKDYKSMMASENIHRIKKKLTKKQSRAWKSKIGSGLSESPSQRKLKQYSLDLKWNWFNRWFYAPSSRLVRRGNQEVLTQENLWKLPEEFKTEGLWNSFEPNWNIEQSKPKPSLFRALRATFGREYYMALFFQFMYACCAFANPILLPYIVEYVANPTIEWWRGVVYVAVVIICSYIGSIFYYRGLFLTNSIGLKMRVVLVQLVYRKVLTLGASRDANSGNIVNLVANDAQFVCDTLVAFTGGIIAPIQVLICIGLLGRIIHAYTLIALVVIVIIVPLTGAIGMKFKKLRFEIQRFADKRLKFTNELLSGIRIVKFYAWEDAFLKNIRALRISELEEVKSLGVFRSILILITGNTTTIIIGAIFLFYAYVGNNTLNAAIAFSVLSFLNLIRFPFFFLSFTVTLVAQYKITFDRIQKFLESPELMVEMTETKQESKVHLDNATFSWEKDAEKAQLSELSLDIAPGKLVMVAGAVGSGKSTLVNALLGEVPIVSGTRYTQPGGISYVAQEAWIFNATLRENILFGLPFDPEKYEDVIEAAALGPDLIQLPDGDQTEIGERGITLSGGQKQRVSIARALYSNTDIFILDDPFSAVDAHVGKHLFENALRGYLKGKTIILITNQLQYLPYADQVVLLKKGKVIGVDTYQSLMESSPELRKMMADFGALEQKSEEEEPKKNAKVLEKGKTFSAVETEKKKAEVKESGLVSWRVYWYYIKNGKAALFLLIIGLYLIGTAAAIVSSWWLAQWSSQAYDYSIGVFIGVYIALLVCQALFNFLAILGMAFFSRNASFQLHDNVISRIVRAPTAFFDITPLGRIINRFAKELSSIDALLPIQMTQVLNSIFGLIGVFAAMLFASPYLIIPIVAAVIFYTFFQVYYRHVSVELQRLESLSRAPILSHLAETRNGISSVRAYRKQETFVSANMDKIDMNTSQLFAMRYCASWYGLVLDVVGVTLVFIVMAVILILRNTSRGDLDIGFVGLTLTYTAGLTQILSNLNTTVVDTETRMNSVERIKEYDALPQEPPAIIPENRPPADWPTKGEIKFVDYSLSYRKGENVLKELNATVEGRDKVGIVGRTGAGKSSMMVALFRMVEPSEGTIMIDGIDVTTIGLKDLRSKLSIIPQEPTLFMGTVRYNLDPFDEADDPQIWDALRMVNLDSVVSALPNKLEEQVSENGGNFSVGERQLICMARALLRKSKILLMDEATASVDLNTDTMIQRMVRENFKDFTVLTIAHRLNTIMDSTKVMVLDKGRISEFDRPAKLLEQPGIFSGMVDANGPDVSAFLRKIAKGEIDVLEANQALNESTSARSEKKKEQKQKEREKEKEKLKESQVVDYDSDGSVMTAATDVSELYTFSE